MATLEELMLACYWKDELGDTVKSDDLKESYFSEKNKEIYKSVREFRQGKYICELSEVKLGKANTEFLSSILDDGQDYVEIYKKHFPDFKRRTLKTRINELVSDEGVIDYRKLGDLIKQEKGTDTGRRKLFNMTKDLVDWTMELDANFGGKQEKYKFNIPEIDAAIGKLKPGSVITIGAGTGIGKTWLALKFFDCMVKQKIHGLYVSAEMSYTELVERLAAMNSKFSYSKILDGNFSKEDLAEIAKIVQNKLFSEYGHVYELSRFNMDTILNQIDNTQAKFVFVDFIQRFIPTGGKDRASFYSDVMNDLKAIAMEKNIIVVVMSRLNLRDLTLKPTLGNLKESGGIAEASDIVFLLYLNEDYSTDADYANLTVMNFDLAKGRYCRQRKMLLCRNNDNCDIFAKKV